MYETLPSDVRDRHPYFMYEEIKDQPDAVARALALAAEGGAEIVRVLARARRIWLVGCGTSLHAAQIGGWGFRTFSRGTLDARAVGAFEFASYLPGIRPDDVVVAVSHSGTSVMTIRAMERAHRCGAETVLITGYPRSPAGKRARYILSTGYEAERSWAHTISYSAALTALFALANDLADPEERLDLSPLPDVMRAALEIEEMAHRVAAGTLMVERYREPPRMVLVGGGPNAVTAHEGVLKLLETSYVPATAFELEEILHGPLAAVDEGSVLVVIAPGGQSLTRAAELTRAAQALGVAPIVLTGEESANLFPEAHRLILPDVPEVLSPLPCVVPLQLISYFLAIGKGLNPDLIHRDDERQREARAQYE